MTDIHPKIVSISDLPDGVEPGDFISIDGVTYIYTGKRRMSTQTTGEVIKTDSCGEPEDVSQTLKIKDYSGDTRIPVEDDKIYVTPYEQVPIGAEVVINGKSYFKTGNTGTVTHALSAVPQFTYSKAGCFLSSDDVG